MSWLGSAKDPGSSSRHLTQLLDGLPVTDRRLDVTGTSTPPIEKCGHGLHIERPGAFFDALEMAIAPREIGT
jgi:pimeloyl-ACP methyl ester carboxylesterase